MAQDTWENGQSGPSTWARRSAQYGMLLLVLAGVILFYAWTARLFEAAPLTRTYNQEKKSYNMLVDAWFQGQLHLPFAPPEGIYSFEDVWNSPDHVKLRRTYWDISLYKGKFYPYFGVTPALLLYAPVRLLKLGFMTDRLAAFIFCVLTLLGALACVRWVARAAGLQPPLWMQAAAIAAVGLCGAAPFFLRVTAVYQVAISCGVCFSIWSVYWFVSGSLAERPVRWRLFACSLCFGLAVAARPTQILWAPLLVLATCLLWRWYRMQAPSASTRRFAIGAFAATWLPAGVLGLAVAGYNHARFDSPFEFGTSFQLTLERQSHIQFSFGAFWPSLYLYLWHPFKMTRDFPFYAVHTQYGLSVPRGLHVEPVAGLFRISPFLLLLFLAPLLFLSRPQHASGAPPRPQYSAAWFIAYLMATAVAGLLLVILVAVYHIVTMRYLLDFTPVLCVAAVCIWFHADALLAGRRCLRRASRAGVLAVLVYSVAANLGLSIMGCGSVRCQDFDRLRAALHVPRNLVAALLGQRHAVFTPARAGEVRAAMLDRVARGEAKKREIVKDALWLLDLWVEELTPAQSRIYLLFQCDRPIALEHSIYIHGRAIPGNEHMLPADRQAHGFMNWDFPMPFPPTTQWHTQGQVLLTQLVAPCAPLGEIRVGLFRPGKVYGRGLVLKSGDFHVAPR
ncbi:MAG: hypothetical protein HYV27_15815 [Candidatus Hydrogenedentes bacterium]|nr:hypothetical protein [Candidatus Hydrogenedentota bacterium]